MTTTPFELVRAVTRNTGTLNELYEEADRHGITVIDEFTLDEGDLPYAEASDPSINLITFGRLLYGGDPTPLIDGESFATVIPRPDGIVVLTGDYVEHLLELRSWLADSSPGVIETAV